MCSFLKLQQLEIFVGHDVKNEFVPNIAVLLKAEGVQNLYSVLQSMFWPLDVAKSPTIQQGFSNWSRKLKKIIIITVINHHF